MTTLRAHFDGRVLVPEGPVNLPLGKSLELTVRDSEDGVTGSGQALPRLAGMRNGVPIISMSPGAKPVTIEDAIRADEEDF